MSINLVPETRANTGNAIAAYIAERDEIVAEIEKISALNREILQSAFKQVKLFDTHQAKVDQDMESLTLKIRQLQDLDQKEKCCNICKVLAGMILVSLMIAGMVYGFVRNPYA